MLNNIRAAANTLIFRCILGIIVIAFIAWGISDVMKMKQNSSIINTDTAGEVSTSEFLKVYDTKLKSVSKSLDRSLTKTEIQVIQEEAIEQLITNLLLKQLEKEYNLDFSDKKIAETIKKMPAFLDEKNQFDITQYYNFLKQQRITEKEYIEDIKNYIGTTTIINNFVNHSYIPEILIQNIINYLAEERTIDLVTLDLNTKKNQIPKHSQEELITFYNNNLELFRAPEKRTISCLVLNNNDFRNKVIVNENDIDDYVANNSITNVTNETKKIIIKDIEDKKINTLINEIYNKIEDELGAGNSLSEISSKFGGKYTLITEVDSITIKNSDVREYADKIFAMNKGDTFIDYKQGYIILELQDIKSSKILEFDQAKDQVENYLLRQANIDTLKKLTSTLNYTNFIKEIKKINLPLTIGVKVARYKKNKIQNIPIELIDRILLASPKTILPVFFDTQKAYLVLVNNSKINTDIANEISKKSFSTIKENIKGSILNEVITFARNKANVTVNKHILDTFTED